MDTIYQKFNSLEAEKQERIINTALKEFARNGYDKASTNEIVKEAGISKGSLFSEPMKTCFDPSILCQELSKIGLRLNEDLSPEDIEKCYFESRENKLNQETINDIDIIINHPGITELGFMVDWMGG